MFEQSLVETRHTLGTRKPLSMLASLAAQIVVLALLVIIPLLHSAILSVGGRSAPLTVPLQEASAPPAPAATPRAAPLHRFEAQPSLRAPKVTPPGLEIATAMPAAAPAWLGAGDAVLSDPTPPLAAIPIPSVQPPPAAPPDKPLPVGGEVEAARCLACPPPAYPAFARQARIEGEVQLQAEISPAGAVTSLRLLNGNALLATAAEQAVRSWRYQPLLLDGRPIPVTTVITVRFRLH
ncbi:MAG TPA: energy transducer TonB [Terriglobales bacterium]|nr:energy transducer TonB [Terriglobales bacterium]